MLRTSLVASLALVLLCAACTQNSAPKRVASRQNGVAKSETDASDILPRTDLRKVIEEAVREAREYKETSVGILILGEPAGSDNTSRRLLLWDDVQAAPLPKVEVNRE